MSHQKKEETATYSYRITALGDSLTEGVGDERNHGYVGRTVQALKKQKQVDTVSYTDYGHRGDTSADLLKVLKRPEVRASVKQSNTIFLTIGGNDLVQVLQKHFMNLQPNDFMAQQRMFSKNLKQVLADVRKLNPAAHIYYFGLYNPFEDYLGKANKDFVPILNNWNANSGKIVKQYPRATFIPTSDIFSGKVESLLYEDHFHPNKTGYQKLASRLLYTIGKSRPASGESK